MARYNLWKNHQDNNSKRIFQNHFLTRATFKFQKQVDWKLQKKITTHLLSVCWIKFPCIEKKGLWDENGLDFDVALRTGRRRLARHRDGLGKNGFGARMHVASEGLVEGTGTKGKWFTWMIPGFVTINGSDHWVITPINTIYKWVIAHLLTTWDHPSMKRWIFSSTKTMANKHIYL